MAIALLLSTAFVTTLPSAPQPERRLQQYVDGFRQIAEVSARYPAFGVFSVDNTVEDPAQIDSRLVEAIDAIPGLKGKYHFFDNEVGRINKGGGLVVQWARVLPDLVGRYGYVVHFEPRQKLVNDSFFERMAQAPGPYVCFYRDHLKFYGLFPVTLLRAWTGLFSMKTEDLLAYVKAPDRGVPNDIRRYKRNRLYRHIRWRLLPGWYAELSECIESDLPAYLERHQLPTTKVRDLGTVWHEEATDKWIEMKDRLFTNA